MVIDYRKTYWGHNFWTYPTQVPESDYHVLAIHTPRISVGDTVLWNTEYGYCELEVLLVEGLGNPPDMYKLEAKVINRYNNEGTKID